MTDLQQAIEYAKEQWARPFRYKPTVMVAFREGTYGDQRRRHLRLFCDHGGIYVRTNKRGQTKRYLHEMHGARIVSAHCSLAVFYEVD